MDMEKLIALAEKYKPSAEKDSHTIIAYERMVKANETIPDDAKKRTVMFDGKRRIKVTVYHDVDTGKRYLSKSELHKDLGENSYTFVNSVKIGRDAAYARYEYIEEMKCIAISLFTISRVKLKANEKRKWKYYGHYFLFADKHVLYKSWNEWKYVPYEAAAKNNIGSLTFNIGFPNMDNLGIDGCYMNCIDNDLRQKLVQLFGNELVIADESVVILDNSLNLVNFLKTKTKPGIKKHQKEIDDILEIHTPHQIPEDIMYQAIEESSAYSKYENVPYSFSFLEHINDETDCIRIFYVNKETNNTNEIYRIYMTKNKILYACNNNGFKYMKAIETSILKNTKLYVYDDIKTDSKFKYYFEIAKENSGKPLSLYLIHEIFLNPMLEKVYKAGYEKLVLDSFDTTRTPYETLVLTFRESYYVHKEDIDKQKDIFRFLGINKYQLNKLYEKIIEADRKYLYSNFFIKPLKVMLCPNDTYDISFIDNKTFDTIFNWLTDFYDEMLAFTKDENSPKNLYCNHEETMLDNAMGSYIIIERIFSRTAALNSLEIMKRHFEEDNIDMILRLYRDYLNMVERINNTETFGYKFEEHLDLREMHDAAVSIYNLNREKYKKEAFKNQSKKWKAFVYENDKFKVIAPEEPEDLANEGMKLHHCVKSYIDRVCNGTTNILFIRKQEDLEKPYFTVEISNDGAIEQIHGFANKNTYTEPLLDAFVSEWIDAKGLVGNNFNKVR